MNCTEKKRKFGHKREKNERTQRINEIKRAERRERKITQRRKS